MKFLRSLLTLLVVALAFASPLHAATHVSIVDLDPVDGSRLAPGVSLYVLMSYETDEPVKLWARPFANGVAVKQTFTNASSDYTGSGEALGWFALRESGHVDEIRVLAGGGNPWREWEVASVPVQLDWSTDGAPRNPSPAWVADLQKIEAARNAEATRQRANEPVKASDVALFNGFMLLIIAIVVACLVLPVRYALRWRGGWRIASLVPVGLMGFVILRIIVDGVRDPTSHNLWPFEILQIGVVALVIVGVLWLARRILGVVEDKN